MNDNVLAELTEMCKSLKELELNIEGNDNYWIIRLIETPKRFETCKNLKNIENSLIYYERANTAGTKQSDILLYQHNPDRSLKDILSKVNGIKVVVNKRRRIYFIDNVKFHFDLIKDLGTFIEVEAIDSAGNIGAGKLKEQCDYYAAFFGIKTSDYIAISYSDMLLQWCSNF